MAVSAPAHNSVLEAAAQTEGGKPLLWHITPGPKLAEAGLPPANSRFIALLPRDQGEPLIVDIFRMAGDSATFTWAVHAKSSDFEVRGLEEWAEVNVELPLRKGRQAGTESGRVEASWKVNRPPRHGLRLVLPISEVEGRQPPNALPRREIEAAHLKAHLKPGALLHHTGLSSVDSSRTAGGVFVAVYRLIEDEDRRSTMAAAASRRPWRSDRTRRRTVRVIHSPRIKRLTTKAWLSTAGRRARWQGGRSSA